MDSTMTDQIKRQYWKPLLISAFPIFLFLMVSCQNNPKRNTKTKANPAWIPLETQSDAHFRGLSVVNEKVAWAAGSKGSWLRTTDGGTSWEQGVVPGADSLQFRDIHAVNSSEAWVLTAGTPGQVFHTLNCGKDWVLQWNDSSETVFYDGFVFLDDYRAMIYGDPQNGTWDLLRTQDGGENWERMETQKLDSVLKGEAGFAASGTGIVAVEERIWIASGGGSQARIFRTDDFGENWQVFETPLKSDSTGCGIFSISFADSLRGVAVGGCYLDSTDREGNCAWTADGGETWTSVETNGPRGYRSCVAWMPDKQWFVTVGRTGSEFSEDFGKTWKPIGEKGYYSCQFAGKTGFATGRGGRAAKFSLN